MARDDAPARQDQRVMTGAQALVRALEELGVSDIFGMPGGAILPFYDPLLASTKIRHVLVRHEQGAGHAAARRRLQRPEWEARQSCSLSI